MGTDLDAKPTTKPQKNKNLNNYPHAKIDLRKAYNMRYHQKLSFGEIAKLFDCDKSSVFRALERFEKIIGNPDDIQVYEANKPNLLSAVEMRLLENLTNEDKLKDASLNNVAYSLTQVSNANRLARGLATEIYDNFTIQASLEDIRKRKQELMKELQVVDITDVKSDNPGDNVT